MASDVKPEDTAVTVGDNVAICVNFTTVEHISSSYEKMTVEGVIQMPLSDQFWGAKFAQFKDKFGVLWFFNLDTSSTTPPEEVKVAPYLRFHDNCREVMESYRCIFGGSLDFKVCTVLENITFSSELRHMLFQTCEGMGAFLGAGVPAESIMHSALDINHGLCSVMACDSCAAVNDVSAGTNVSISTLFTDETHMLTAFEKLSSGGQILRPLERQFWGGMLGQCADKYGLRWMFVGPHGSGESCTDEVSAGEDSHVDKKAKVDT